MALPVASCGPPRHPDGDRVERSTYLVLAMPGIVIAFAVLLLRALRNGFLYQSAPMLILAYAILFFPLALVGVASVAHAPAGLEDVAGPSASAGWPCCGG